MDRLIFGKPAVRALVEEAERLNAGSVFLIVSNTLNKKTDEIGKIRDALGARYAGTFDGVEQHTTRQQAVKIAADAIELRTDLVVAIGGGSVIDSAKIVLMCMEHGISEPAGLDGFEVVMTPAGPEAWSFSRPQGADDRHPDHIVRWRVQRCRARYRHEPQTETELRSSADDAAFNHP
ncbi:iron-containing alcohol dehydrogenase [Bradyrhizobium sp. TZ2]